MEVGGGVSCGVGGGWRRDGGFLRSLAARMWNSHTDKHGPARTYTDAGDAAVRRKQGGKRAGFGRCRALATAGGTTGDCRRRAGKEGYMGPRGLMMRER